MIEKILTVRNRAGIHARPAALIAQTANKFASEIFLEKENSSVNAKSIIGILSLAIMAGEEIYVYVINDNEDLLNRDLEKVKEILG